MKTSICKGVEEDIRKWRDLHTYGLIKLILQKQSFYQKPLTDSMLSQSKSPEHFLQKQGGNPKIVWHQKKKKKPQKIHSQYNQYNPKQEEQPWRDYHSRFQDILQSHNNKTVWYKWYETENPSMSRKSYIYLKAMINRLSQCLGRWSVSGMMAHFVIPALWRQRLTDA